MLLDFPLARCRKKANPEGSLSHKSFLNWARRLDTIGAEVAAGVKYSSFRYRVGSIIGKSGIFFTSIVSTDSIVISLDIEADSFFCISVNDKFKYSIFLNCPKIRVNFSINKN